jgi:cytochrome c oxidase subunit 1
VQFSIGGFTGLMLGALSVNIHVQDTYFVVGHFHYVMFGGTGFGLFAAMHYWFPKMFGRMYNRRRAVVAWVLTTVGFNVLYFPFFFLGYLGMPRRYYDFLPEYQGYHVISTVGSWILITGLILLFANLIIALRKGGKAPADPWGGKTLEWTVPSPPPVENFHVIPTVTRGPYDYSTVHEHATERT